MPTPNTLGLPDLGVGIGIGADQFAAILSALPEVDWIEVVPEHVIESRGRPAHELEELAEHYPIALHGLSMSIGSADPLDTDYLGELATLASRLGAAWVSDHLCWTGVDGAHSHTLLPLPYDEATLAHVTERVRRAQDILARRVLIENPASYLRFARSTIPEHEFLGRLAEAADCGLLLDLGNLEVSRRSGAIASSTADYLDALPADRVVELHLSGYVELPTHAMSAAGAPVSDDTWAALARARTLFGSRATAIDRTEPGANLEKLLAEVLTARTTLARAASANGATDGD